MFDESFTEWHEVAELTPNTIYHTGGALYTLVIHPSHKYLTFHKVR